MIKDVPPIFRKREPRVKPKPIAPPPPGPVAPVLIAAIYEALAYVDLTFDRAVDVGGIDVASVVVVDGYYDASLAGSEATPLDATTVRVTLADPSSATAPGVHLIVAPGNGIVAVDGGAAWAGVDDLSLPFGA